MDFLFHEVTEKERQEIKKQAKGILDDFSNKLSRVKEIKEVLIERGEGGRREGEGKCNDGFSREIMFENAPEKNEDFIIAEKKGW